VKQSRIVRSSSEDSIQRGITKYLRTMLPSGWVVFAIPNGGSRNVIEAAKLKATGTLAGMPDLCILGCREWGVEGAPDPEPVTFFIEVKSASGRPSLPQLDMHDRLLDLGHSVGIARSIDDAKALCIKWGLPIRDASAKEAA
jgi:hypothetical protein